MNIKFLKAGLVSVLGMAVIALSTQAIARTLIKDTRHNLSNWGSYNVRAVSETQVCIFCHAPHNADSTQAPLWNHEDTTNNSFGMASSTYMNPGNTYGGDATFDNQPTGISKKCLSCHDGTVAIGSTTNNGTIEMTGSNIDIATGKLKSSAPGNLGNDLSKGHIISFQYTDNLVTWLNDAARYGSGRFNTFNDPDTPKMLDKTRRMQCHTCHDPHNDWCNDPASKIGKDPLWRLECNAAGNGSVCEKCHSGTYDLYTSPDLKHK